MEGAVERIGDRRVERGAWGVGRNKGLGVLAARPPWEEREATTRGLRSFEMEYVRDDMSACRTGQGAWEKEVGKER